MQIKRPRNLPHEILRQWWMDARNNRWLHSMLHYGRSNFFFQLEPARTVGYSARKGICEAQRQLHVFERRLCLSRINRSHRVPYLHVQLLRSKDNELDLIRRVLEYFKIEQSEWLYSRSQCGRWGRDRRRVTFHTSRHTPSW